MAAIIDKKPKRHTNGATLIRRALKMSGLKACSVEPLPAIRMKPMMTITIPAANRMKLVLPNAKSLLSIIYLLKTVEFVVTEVEVVVDGEVCTQ